MSDEMFPDSRLRALSPARGLVRSHSLVTRALSLVATWERLADARTQLALAHHSLALAERLLSRLDDQTACNEGRLIDPTTWDIFARHSRDAYHRGLLAMAIHLQVNRGEGPVDCLEHLRQRSREVPSCLPRGFPRLFPEIVNDLDEIVTAIDSDRPRARSIWETSVVGEHTAMHVSLQKLFLEDAAAVVEGRPGEAFDALAERLKALLAVTAVLRRAQLSHATCADALRAFHAAETPADLVPLLNRLPIPQAVKAELWDLKAGRSDSSYCVDGEG